MVSESEIVLGAASAWETPRSIAWRLDQWKLICFSNSNLACYS